MPYTPPFSMRATVSIRRLAWAYGTHMTKAVEKIVDMIPDMVDAEMVCNKCRDKQRCRECTFGKKKKAREVEKMLGV